MAEEQAELRDLVYLDFDKAASLFSQVAGGLVREVQEGSESAKDERNIRKYDLKLFKPEFGGIATEKTSVLESRVLHHDVLLRLERALFEMGTAVDLNTKLAEQVVDAPRIRQALTGFPYLRAEGWAFLEDYERIKQMAAQFNPLMQFIAMCSMQAGEAAEKVKEARDTIAAQRAVANAEKDRNRRAKALIKTERAEKQLLEYLQQAATLQVIPDWLVEGVGSFIDTFMRGRITLSIYPFESVPAFRVLANLKRDCFVDSDLEHVRLAYGSRPNVRLTILGLVTSVPEREGKASFDPMKEFEGAEAPDVAFEKGFRTAFAAFDHLEGFVRYSRYPNVTVFPVAVYRRIRPTMGDK